MAAGVGGSVVPEEVEAVVAEGVLDMGDEAASGVEVQAVNEIINNATRQIVNNLAVGFSFCSQP